jgi:hypothetical protein
MDIEQIRRRAQEIWEAEGRPEGQHDRHWQQAEQELFGGGELPKTSSPAHHSATTIPEGGGRAGSHVVPAEEGLSGSSKPRKLASKAR